MLIKKRLLGLLLIIGLTFVGCIAKETPTVKMVDQFIADYKNETSEQKRVEILRNLLLQLHDPKDKAEDAIVSYALDQLESIYKSSYDEAILAAVDNTHIDAGFANYICGFYNNLRNENTFIMRMRSDSSRLEGVKRCIGITFSIDEINEMLE